MLKRILLFVLALSLSASLFVSCRNGESEGEGGSEGSGGATLPPHACESVCEDCHGCLDTACERSECRGKCICALSIPADPSYPTLSARMPAIYIDTADGSNEWATKYNRASKLAGLIDYTDAAVSTGRCAYGEKISAAAEVKVRGNYTLEYEKKPIRIKFEEKTNLFGLHDGEKYKSWVLLADYKDLSMLNNTVAFYLGNAILGADGYYATDFRTVEVYLNGEYWGVYLLVEQQEAKDGRTSAPAVPKSYTGTDVGYFFEYDGYYDLEGEGGDPYFIIDHKDIPAENSGYTVKSDINDPAQLAFLESYMNNVFLIAYEAVVNGAYYKFNEDYTALVPAPEYTSAADAVGAVIDVPSLVDTYILNELACDLDVDWSSFYLSLDMTAEGEKKLVFEAPWDFDSSFGLIKGEPYGNAEALYAAVEKNPWFLLLVSEDWFDALVREKWADIRARGILENALSLVSLQKEIYKNYYASNYERWPSRLYGNSEVNPILNTYNDARTAEGLAADYLSAWLSRRIAFLDSLWLSE